MNYKTQKFINKITFGLTEMGSGFSFIDIWYNLKYGFKNLKLFFWVVWKYRGFDYTYNLLLMKRGLEIYLTFPNYEVDENRIPKEEKIKRVIEIINNLDKQPYIDRAEKELGELYHTDMEFKKLDETDGDGSSLYELIDNKTDIEKEHNHKVFIRSEEIEQTEWNELFDTMKKDAQGWWN